MTTVLRTDPDGKMRIRWHDKKYPTNVSNLALARQRWLSSCDRLGNVAEVPEGERLKFECLGRGELDVDHPDVDGAFAEGIVIPNDCYEIRSHEKADTLEVDRM